LEDDGELEIWENYGELEKWEDYWEPEYGKMMETREMGE
jgi:hypothetical protein